MATLAQPSVTVHMARGYIPYSIEVQQDYPGFAAEMMKLLDQGYTDLLAAKTVTGSGSGEPRGIFTALDANTNDEVVTTTDGSFGGEDIFKVWNALPERYRPRSTWLMSVHVQSAIRRFAASATANSAYFTDRPDRRHVPDQRAAGHHHRLRADVRDDRAGDDGRGKHPRRGRLQ
jgi:HK97 family phage major capsid protein